MVFTIISKKIKKICHSNLVFVTKIQPFFDIINPNKNKKTTTLKTSN